MFVQACMSEINISGHKIDTVLPTLVVQKPDTNTDCQHWRQRRLIQYWLPTLAEPTTDTILVASISGTDDWYKYCHHQTIDTNTDCQHWQHRQLLKKQNTNTYGMDNLYKTDSQNWQHKQLIQIHVTIIGGMYDWYRHRPPTLATQTTDSNTD